MSEMVQRVARAMLTADTPMDGEVISPLCRTEEDICHLARAAIAAMREPTAEMKEEGAPFVRATTNTMGRVRADDVWRAMIDAAMEE